MAASKKSSTKSQTFDFERSLTELEQLVERMERGDLTLEESLASFERGITLTRACQQALREAEQKVELLTQRQDKEVLVPFEIGKDDDGA